MATKDERHFDSAKGLKRLMVDTLKTFLKKNIWKTMKFAYSSIILNLSDSVIRKVGKLETAKELWDRLEELFTETSLPSKLFLLEKFFRYKLDLSKNIDENIDEFTKLVQDIKLTGDKNIDDYIPIVLLNAIPETYSDVKAAIKYGRDNVSLDTVINGLKSKEMDIKTNKINQPSSEINFVRGRTKNRNSDYKYRKGGRSISRSKSRSKSRGRDERFRDDKYRERRCYNYGDSGCSFHMSPYKEIFSSYKTDDFGFVAMANEKLCGIKGLGDVCVTFDNGYKLTLKNVRHVPNLCHNLMSCSALEEEGLEGRWGKGIMKIMKGSLNVFKAKRKRNLYMCSVKYDCFTASVSIDDKASLWHRRLGHISLKGLDLLHKDGLLPDKFKDLNFCDDCVLGKQHKVHFPASPYPNSPTSNDILDYVHADVVGPSNVETHGGNKYFLSIIDNMSCKVFVFLMKQKAEVFEKFKQWKIFVENQTGRKLKVLRTDNGLEFCNQNFTELCNEFGIKRHKTNPYTPQQNGVAERMNRTLLNKVRCLLISSGLPKSFWGEALLTAAYLVKSFSFCASTCLARNRERREHRIPSRFRDFHLALNSKDSEPTSHDDAIKSPKSEFWIKAMKEEMKSLKDKTWVLVPKPKNTSIVDSKWIFKLKNENDSLRYKARLVAKGFTQKGSPVLSMIENLQNDLRKTFEMKDLGNAKKILGMTIDRDRKTSSIFLNQKAYVISVLEKFSMINAKSSSVPLATHFQLSKDQSPKSDSEKKHMEKVPYSNVIGYVMYLMVCTRPDIAYAVSCLSRYMSNAGPPHWEALKWLLRCLSGSANTGTGMSYLAVWSLGVILGELYSVVEQPVLGFQPYRGCVTRFFGSGHSEPFSTVTE
ncbi:UNVERIFIED_CONTAM: Retrovirus-related Pol polyprotein from transposon TNT 1-94 [Sesamum latifolium]|uniref:Retrovirus-related Pol polyprotein from transposon TNT 1-94 n=1 Tax=Sesamum latifolium TaxID=2727402 RepID=A0AAW2W8J4_9LAMI